MGWVDYYKLLEKYKGDLSKATKAELRIAAGRNPDNPVDARKLAEEKWEEDQATKSPYRMKVLPEGREGVWTVEKDEVLKFLDAYTEEEIHNFLPSGHILLGCDWTKESVIETVKKANRIAILTGDAQNGNARHALSVIGPHNDEPERLLIFDIGPIEEKHLEILEPAKV